MSRKNKKSLDAIETWIGADTSFVGNISTTKSIRVDGKLTGNIENSENIVIGETAEIEGNINTKYIKCHCYSSRRNYLSLYTC